MHRRIRAVIGGVVAVATAATITSCSTPAPDADGPTSLTIAIDETTYAFTNSPFHGMNLGYFGGQALYESLWVPDLDEAGYAPWLATEWELSDDNTRMAITLREDVDFVDGTHMDAEAVAEFYNLAITTEGAALMGIAVRDGLAVEATGEYTLEFTTSINPMGPRFMNDFSSVGGIASPVASQDLDTLQNTPAGTGPYLITEHVTDVSISFERNPDYWNPAAYPYDELTYLVFTDLVAASNALKSGQVDVTRIDKPLAADIEGAGFTTSMGGGEIRGMRLLDYEGRIVPALADPRVREAIAMAFDQEAILESLEHGYGHVDDQPYPTDVDTYIEDEGADLYPYDVEAAKELLAEAGYPDGFDMTLAGAPQSVAFYPFEYEAIVEASMAEIGIRLTFERFSDTTTYIAALQSGDYPIQIARADYANVIGSIAQKSPFVGYYADDEEFMSRVFDYQSGKEGAGQELGQYLLDQIWYVVFVHTGVIWAMDTSITLQRPTWIGSVLLSAFRPAE